MPYVKFHEKNVAIFAAKESTSGTYQAPVAADAIASTAIEGGITRETGAVTFIGDSLLRDEYTFIKDSYADASLTTPQQVLGTLNASLVADAAPMSDFYQSCGGFVSVLGVAVGSYAAGTVIVDNNSVSNTTVSIDMRKNSPDDAANDKLVKFLGCRGMMDLTANMGEIPSLKFSMKGNFVAPATAVRLAPDFASQMTQLAASIKKDNLVTTQIAPLTGTYTPTTGGALTIAGSTTSRLATLSVASVISPTLATRGSAVGDICFITVSGASDAAYNGTFLATIVGSGTAAGAFLHYQTKTIPTSAAPTGTIVLTMGPVAQSFSYSTLSAPNFFGFDLTRYLTGTEEGFAKGAVPTDVTVSMLEDKAGTTNFDPESSTNISAFFAVKVKYGTAAGKYVSYLWDKLQLTNVKDGKIATYYAKDCTFRNTGKSYVIFE